MNQSREAAYWLALLHDSQVKRRVAKEAIYRWCIEGGRSLSSLFELSADQVAGQLELDAQRAAQLLAAAQSAPVQASLLGDLSRRGIEMITRADVAYPDALVECLSEEWLPYFFFYRGGLHITTEPGLAILGGGQPSPEAGEIARQVARMLAEGGYHLVGGYDKGIDRMALDTARGAEGQVTIILPLGIEHFESATNTMEEALRQGRMLLLSPYAPDASYSEALARARLALVAGLSEALMLIAPSYGPTDWPALDQFTGAGGRLFIWSGTDAELASAWIGVGALPFEDATTACQLVLDLFGTTPNALEGESAALSDVDKLGDFEGTEPIVYADADSAIEALSHSGTVPDVLARRLREAERLHRADDSDV